MLTKKTKSIHVATLCYSLWTHADAMFLCACDAFEVSSKLKILQMRKTKTLANMQH